MKLKISDYFDEISDHIIDFHLVTLELLQLFISVSTPSSGCFQSSSDIHILDKVEPVTTQIVGDDRKHIVDDQMSSHTMRNHYKINLSTKHFYEN